MDFSQVKAITIPEGNVLRILSGTTVLWEKTRLPAEYQEVEYIESTGTQYINIGITNTQHITAHLDIQFTQYSSSSMIIIAWSTGSGRWFGKGGNNTYSAGNDASSDVNALTRKEIDVIFTSSNITFVIDGVTYSKEASSASQSNGYTMFAGRNVTSGNVTFYAKAKLYKATIQENGETIRELVPCYRKIDNVLGVYDVVNDVFYTNAGTGKFITGDDTTRNLVDNITENENDDPQDERIIDIEDRLEKIKEESEEIPEKESLENLDVEVDSEELKRG